MVIFCRIRIRTFGPYQDPEKKVQIWIRIRNNAPGKDFNLIFKRLKLGIIGFTLQMSNEKLRLD